MLSAGKSDGKDKKREEIKKENDANLKSDKVKVRAMEEIACFFDK
jgi:hypothetical protein